MTMIYHQDLEDEDVVIARLLNNHLPGTISKRVTMTYHLTKKGYAFRFLFGTTMKNQEDICSGVFITVSFARIHKV